MRNITRITLIVCMAVLVLMTALLTGCSGLENGIIMDGVTVAGVDVGGMTKEDAVSAVRLATADTYPQNTMVIHILDGTIELTPELTGVSLDAEAAIEAAYALGRTGSRSERQAQQQQAMTTGLRTDISGFLNLDDEVLYATLARLSEEYSNVSLTQPTYEITGERPDLAAEELPEELQTLVITMGTPEFLFDLDDLYVQVMDAYQDNVFEMEYLCQMTEPELIDLDTIYEENYIEPVDAVMNQETFEVSDHTYGYGFDLEAAKKAVSEAKYGETVEIPFVATAPEQTKEALASLLFRDVLASHTAYQYSSYSRATNLKLACEALDGTVINPGEVFDYNQCLGERTPEKGYMPAASYEGGKTVNTYGGGICQPSSVLYYCALLSDLEIVTRVCHQFISSYIDPGMDATVSWGGPDFRFRNNTPYPIRIEAEADGGSVTISLIGTDTKDYYVEMEYEILGTYGWDVEYVEMDADNEDGYKDGDVITTPYTGYSVRTYKCRYSKADDTLIERVVEADSRYDSRDKEIAKIIEDEPDETVPSNPTIPEPSEEPSEEPSQEPSEDPSEEPSEDPSEDSSESTSDSSETEETGIDGPVGEA